MTIWSQSQIKNLISCIFFKKLQQLRKLKFSKKFKINSFLLLPFSKKITEDSFWAMIIAIKWSKTYELFNEYIGTHFMDARAEN